VSDTPDFEKVATIVRPQRLRLDLNTVDEVFILGAGDGNADPTLALRHRESDWL
jgi:hypothetical protein